MSAKKKPDTAALLKSDVAVALQELGLDPDAIKSLPRPLLTYLTQLHEEFLVAEAKVENLEGEVGSANDDLQRLRRQRDLLRAALAKADDIPDPVDAGDYSQPSLPPLRADQGDLPGMKRSKKRKS